MKTIIRQKGGDSIGKKGSGLRNAPAKSGKGKSGKQLSAKPENMKNHKHFLIFVILLFQYTTTNANVLEIGGGFSESYNGEFPVWSDSSIKMESLSMPITISLMFDNLRRSN